MNTTLPESPQINDNKTPAMIEAWNLNKIYRTGFFLNQKLQSLKDLSLRVESGETFGLLGPNGAGKTTLLKILLGIIRPTSGKGTLMGYPIGNRAVKQRIGYLPENAYFYDYLTAWEFLEFTAGLFQLPKEIQIRRIPELLNLVGIDKKTAQKKQLKKYSKGMLQRVGMAQTLINDPELVFLDEPMSGLDPTGRYQIREIILSLKEQGKTIFFNSHILTDVEQICDRIAILAKGELLCLGSLKSLLGTSNTYQVTVQGGSFEVLERWINNLTPKDDYWIGILKGEAQEFLASLHLMDAKLINLKLAKMTLEEFFIQQIEQEKPELV